MGVAVGQAVGEQRAGRVRVGIQAMDGFYIGFCNESVPLVTTLGFVLNARRRFFYGYRPAVPVV